MEYLLYLVLPFIWLFMLFEWVYKKLSALFYWLFSKIARDKQATPRRQNEPPDDRRLPAEGGQGERITPMEKETQENNGMNPQERTIPYITPDPPKREPKKKPKKEKPIEIIFEPPRKTDNKKRRGNDRGGR